MSRLALADEIAAAIEEGDVLKVGYLASKALEALEAQRERARANERLADRMAEAMSMTLCTCLFGQLCGKCIAMKLYEERDVT